MPNNHFNDPADELDLDVSGILDRHPGLRADLDRLLGLFENDPAHSEQRPMIPVFWDGDAWELRPDWWADAPESARAELPVAEGLLAFLADDPWAPPRIAADGAASWLVELLGEEAAALIAQRADAIPEELLEPTELRLAASRLAVGAWVRHWWPRTEPIPRTAILLADIELAVLATTCAALAPPAVDPTRHATGLLDLIAALPQLTDPPPRIEHVLAQAVELMVRSLGVDDPLWGEYAALAARVAAGAPLVSAEQSDYALTAGGGSDAPVTDARWDPAAAQPARMLTARWAVGVGVLTSCPPDVDDPELPFLAELLDWNDQSGTLGITLPRTTDD